MSTAGAFDDTPIESMEQLAGWFAEGCKPKDQWRIGAEHEKFGFRLADHAPLPFKAPTGEPSIQALLAGMQRFQWAPLEEAGELVGLKRDGATIALEPGGQFELSGAPLETLHDVCAEVNGHLREVKTVADEIGAGFLNLAAAPTWSLADMPRTPKARYAIMRNYMPKVGRLGLEMMHRTSTVQVNLDFDSEADMVKKLRVAIALQPLATALFANSPFIDGRPNGWLSYRAHVWSDTDPDRTGMLPFVFEDGFGFERYAAWAVDAPMYFLRRDGVFHDVTGHPFRLLLEGRLPGHEGERAMMGDWIDHLSTLFPEARIKQYLETRGADGGPWARLCALPALWVGLLYDADSLDRAWRLVKNWTSAEREALRLAAPALGLRAPTPKGGWGADLRGLAREVLGLARKGLKRRAKLNPNGHDETHFLDSLDDIVASGRTPAEYWLECWEGAWRGDLEHAFAACAY